MATAVTITAAMADEIEQYPKAVYPIGSQNPYVGMLQALLALTSGGTYANYAGSATVDGTDVTAGYKDITFATERPSTDYEIFARLKTADGSDSTCSPDDATKATTGFRVYLKEQGTLRWIVIGHQS